MSADDDSPPGLVFEVPNRLRAGVYANAANITFSGFEFTLDWAVGDAQDPARAIVCSRVRIPVGFVIEVLQGINRVMAFYEQSYGEIRRPGE